MLTDTRIRNAKPQAKPYKLTDGKGLFLEVKPTGAKLWRYRYRIAGKENLFAAGEYAATPERETSDQAEIRRNSGRLTLAEARVKREEWRSLVKAGIHPAHERKLGRIRQDHEARTTFEAVLKDWMATRHWSESTKANRMSQIEMHLLPALGAMPVRQITPSHVLDVLKRAETKESDTRTRIGGNDTRLVGGGTVVARLRQIMSGAFDHAIATLRADTNPAAPIRGAFKVPRTTHKTPLTRPQIGMLLRALTDYPGQFQTGVALQLLWLTLARPTEVTGARWSEIDLEGGTWTIPEDRMKMGEEHVIPLPAQAVDLLRRLHGLTGAGDPVFPHRDRRKEPMTYDALNKGIQRLDLSFQHTPHAARTTASTLLNEMGFRPDVIERQLAHQERNAVRRAYNRATYLDERRVMMQQWANMLDDMRNGDGKIVPIAKGEAA
ncbi:MAG TPA: integrase arm-type DNA-binding domain-containing protein [Rhodocyclaceae bacterium]|nr:integrase arm-type DNA-binding domain-containing protein [Rhodocyclaceae bacterium]